jgi:putative membrane protein
MIVRPRPSFLQLFFVMRGSIIPRILPQIVGFALYASAVVIAAPRLGLDLGGLGIAPFGLIGVTLSIYLGFRNSAAYDRWWEARKLLGQLVYDTRNVSRAAIALVEDLQRRRLLLMHVLAFCHLLRGQLRGTDALAEARTFVGASADRFAATANGADAVLREIGKLLGEEYRGKRIDPIGFRILDERVSSLAAVQAGCERIAGTPLPFAYTLLLQRTAYVVCLLLPFGLVSSVGWATPLFTVVIAYCFFGLDALSQELEDPFGTEANDLALDGLCRVCEISILEALEEPAPPPPKATHYYYS